MRTLPAITVLTMCCVCAIHLGDAISHCLPEADKLRHDHPREAHLQTGMLILIVTGRSD